jgi:cytoskeletal protein CcmA (bactofilin family)
MEMALFNNESEKTVEPGSSARVPSVSMTPPATGGVLLSVLTPNGNQAYLDQGTKVNGRLNFEGPAQIDGQIEGEIHARDSLMIGKCAVVTAKIKAVSIIVAGTVSGEIEASQRIELHPSAKVSGILSAPKMVVHEGAVFEGSCKMQPKALREDHKLSSSRKEEHLVGETSGQEHPGQV